MRVFIGCLSDRIPERFPSQKTRPSVTESLSPLLLANGLATNSGDAFNLIRHGPIVMKYKSLLLCFLGLLSATTLALAQGSAFAYRGDLTSSGSPATGLFDLRFTLHSVNSGGPTVGGPLTNSAALVSNGVFAVVLDFGVAPFDGADLWLEISVRTNGGGAFTTLSPRQQILPLPYAVTAGNLAGTLPAGALAGAYSGAVTLSNLANSFSGNGSGLTGINAQSLGGQDAGTFWQRGGNSGTTPGLHFLGTADNQPLEVKVNASRALRMEPNPEGAPNIIGGSPFNSVETGIVGATIAGGGAVNYSGDAGTNSIAADFGTVSGGFQNQIGPNSTHATIGGGSYNAIEQTGLGATIGGGNYNRMTTNTDAATIAGGYGNEIHSFSYHATIGGGNANQIQASAHGAIIAGGDSNFIQAGSETATLGGGRNNNIGNNSHDAVIAGGENNHVSTNAFYSVIGGGRANENYYEATYSFVGGGRNNTNYGDSAVIAGGEDNTTYGHASTVPGGVGNDAHSHYSFAAGHRAKAIHQGSFVWADSQDVDFSSTADDQFSVRAIGGVVLETGGAGLVVDGVPLSSGGAVLGQRLNIGVDHTLTGALATIAGGASNTNRGGGAVISGGMSNAIESFAFEATIAGGKNNRIDSSGVWAAIGGGWRNEIQVNAQSSVIGGGRENVIEPWSQHSVIAGGSGNTVQSNSSSAVISGGDRNSIGTNGYGSTIGGGWINRIGNTMDSSTIGGGHSNTNFADGGTIGGGTENKLGDFASQATIAGGDENAIGNSGIWAAIGGGWRNEIQVNSQSSVIGGGRENVIEPWSQHSVIAGGSGNTVQSNSSSAAISGGDRNTIGTNSYGSIVGGGWLNRIGNAAQSTVITGGHANTNEANRAVIGGGEFNRILFSANGALIAGGISNFVDLNGNSAVIGGGSGHSVGSASTVISGGMENTIDGYSAKSSIVGGAYNNILGHPLFPSSASTIGGGASNFVGVAKYATIPGGLRNSAQGDFAFAAGHRARADHAGAFVWADALDEDFRSTAFNQFLVRAAGGVGVGATNLTGALYLRHPMGVPAAAMNAADNGLGLGQYSESSYKWIQSYGGPLVLNPRGNNVGIGVTNPAAPLQVVNATCDGNNWVNSSDRNVKENFKPIDPQAVLAKVANLPIQEWNYISTPGQMHVGPVAQDFKAAFNLGADDKHIATVDADGVAFAAIQGLNEKVEGETRKAETRIQKLEAEDAELRSLVAELQRQMRAVNLQIKGAEK